MESMHGGVPSNDSDVLSARNTDKEYKYSDVLQHEQSTDLCWICGKHLKTAKSLKTHLQTHNKDYCRDWKESEGTDGDGDNEEMKEGPRSQGTKTKSQTLNNLCWVCGKCFNSTKNLRAHLQTQHKDTYKDWRESEGTGSDEDSDIEETKTKIQPSDYLCWVCGKFLSSAETLMLHLQTHNVKNGSGESKEEKQS